MKPPVADGKTVLEGAAPSTPRDARASTEHGSELPGKRRVKRNHGGPTAIELIEESVHLLRRAPTSSFAIYLAGAAPFALGVMFFVAHVTWFHPPAEVIAWNALGLVVLFAAMKVAQAEFCARLLAQRLGSAPAPLTVSRAWRLGRIQFALHGWGVLSLPVALVITVPFPWLYAYFQSASVIGESKHLAAESRAQAALWPAQNALGQLLLSALAIAVWINIATAFWLVPWLANRLLGLQNIFGFSGWWFVNTTFLAATAVLTWLACDPLVKAFFTLRVFYGRARKSGEDLRVDLRHVGRRKPIGALVAVALALLVVTQVRAPAAEKTAPPPPSVDARQLDATIERMLARNEYRWRLRPLPNDDLAAKNAGPIARFFRAGAEWMEDFFRWARHTLNRVLRWIFGLFPDWKPSGSPGTAAGGLARALVVLVWIFVGAVVLLLIGTLVIAWRRRKIFKSPNLAAEALPVAVPDLRDEATQAAQLPVDGWLGLARQQIAMGEWRLAWRALHLATLAHLAGNGLVSLAKFKTNLDYERELHRRAAGRGELTRWFSARSRSFEAAWYGQHAATEALAREWLAELETPTKPETTLVANHALPAE